MKRRNWTIAAAAVLVLLVLAGFWVVASRTGMLHLFGGGQRTETEDSPSEQAAQLWEAFCRKNRAWLDPDPPAMRYTLCWQEYKPVAPETRQWRDGLVIHGWYAPGGNVKFEASRVGVDANDVPPGETYYADGVGRLLSDQSNLRHLRADTWLCARTGPALLSSLHLLAWWGLPETTTIQEDPNGIVLLKVEMPSPGSPWWRDSFVGVSYGSHEMAFGDGSAVFPVAVEVEIDRATLRPRRLVEKERGGAATVVHFGASWLSLADGEVPAEIECTTPASKTRPEEQYELAYRFEIRDGVWFLKDMSRTWDAIKYASRLILQDLHVEAPDPNVFDITLPARSETTLKPGERIVTFTTSDGLTLEGKLSVPVHAVGRIPVVFLLGGAGPWTFDRRIPYVAPSNARGAFPEPKTYDYCGFYAEQLARRGIAFFRVNKRGCAPVPYRPYVRVNRRIFSATTPSVLLDDYRCALEALRSQSDIDPNAVVLMGLSEGTALAPRLAQAHPEGIAGIAMLGYVEDGLGDVITWQNTVGPWRNLSLLFDKDEDGRITEEEFDAVMKQRPGAGGVLFTFKQLDRDKDGVVTPKEVEARSRLEVIQKAVWTRDDNYLWENLLNLTSAYLLEDWGARPNHETLLKLQIPLAIFHGQNDGSCRVEGVQETQEAFAKAGRDNLTVKIYPKADHDLNWTQFLREGTVPQAFEDVFAAVEQMVKEAD